MMGSGRRQNGCGTYFNLAFFEYSLEKQRQHHHSPKESHATVPGSPKSTDFFKEILGFSGVCHMPFDNYCAPKKQFLRISFKFHRFLSILYGAIQYEIALTLLGYFSKTNF